MAYCTPFHYRVAPRQHRVSAAPSFFYPSSASSAAAAYQADFVNPFLRIFGELDNLSGATVTGSSQRKPSQQAHRSWQPRFDVREESDAYHLQGELPGVDQSDLDIEFTEPTTLVVRGHTVREHAAGTPPAEQTTKTVEQQSQETQPEASTSADDAAAAEAPRPVSPLSDSASTYQRPSVEEERDEDWTEAVPTPTTAEETKTIPPNEQQQVVEQQQQQQPAPQKTQSHYWVSERSVGSFQRTFTFPGQVDQNAVTASLKNGVLSVVVPKQQLKGPRKILVQ